MICKSCKFENREGALFCAECGAPLASSNDNAEKPDVEKTVILDQVVTNSKESVEQEDESEANTTVLTSDMLKPAQPVAPKEFAAGPAPVKPMAPQMATPSGQPVPQASQMVAPSGQPVPQKPQMAAPSGQPVPQAPQMAAPSGQPVPQKPQMAAPSGQPVPQKPQMAAPAGQPAPQAPQMAAPAGQPAPQKPAVPEEKPNKKADKKADKKAAKAAKKANKGKMGAGTKVYIVISIILILALGGALAYGYFIFHKGKMDDAKTEKEGIVANYEAQLSEKNSEIASLYASSTDAQTTITNLETQLADSQLAQAEAQATANSYVAYDPLINFVETCSADSSTDMIVSDTVVYATAGETLEVFVYFPSQEGKLSYTVSDVAVVDCTWGEEWVNGNVLPIYIDAKAAGDVTIEVTNDQNDVKETIFVHVE